MIRNEYRRAFIMLRAAMQGYGGHVRLERRTLTGSMYFIVTAPQGVSELSAALAGQQNGEYFVAPIGPLARDRRGQLALAWQFDPRAIAGRPLEAYSWVVVAATGGPCAVALTGNVEGSRQMDPVALGRAVCALFDGAREATPEAAQESVLDDSAFVERQTRFEAAEATPDASTGAIPELVLEDSAFVERQTRFEAVQSTPAEPAQAEAVEGSDTAQPAEETGSASEAPEGEAMRGDVRIYTLVRSRPRPAERRRTSQRDASADGAPDAAADRPTEAPEPAQVAEASEAQSSAPNRREESEPVAAAKQLGLDITAPWPDKAEPLRRLFATQAPAEAPLADGYTYVRSPMPAGSGYGDCLAGLRTENGRITGIRCAVPARQSPEPPAGLENYTWIPTGGANGVWVWEETI